MTKTAFVTFASHDSERYQKNLARQREAFALHAPNVDYFAFTRYEEINSPTHQEVNYGFKACAMQCLIELGYTKIVWVDSAVYPIAPINSFLAELDKSGVVFFDNVGLPLWQWISDLCLQIMYDSDREGVKVVGIKQIMGCLFGVDITTLKGGSFARQFAKYSLNPKCANGSWTNENLQVSKNKDVRGHRHDQSIASIILRHLAIEPINPMQTYLAYTEWLGRKDLQINKESVCFYSNSY